MPASQTLAEATANNTSFSRTLPGLQLAVDSHSLGEAKTCLRKYYYSVVLGYQPRDLSVHLVFGLAMHSGTERYHHQRAAGASHEDALDSVLDWALRETWVAALGRPWQSDHPVKNRLTLLRSLVWYLDTYGEADPLQTIILANGKPAVELSFSFDSGFASHSGEQFHFCGHLDRLALLNDLPYIPDLKTTLQSIGPWWFDKFTPDNQFSMYTLAGQVVWRVPVHGLVVDGCQILAGGTRFQRGLVARPQPVIDEWHQATGYWLRQLEDCATDGAQREALGEAPEPAWPMNDKACDMYGGCQFRGICSKPPASRPQWLASDFHRRVWDPLQRRGDI